MCRDYKRFSVGTNGVEECGLQSQGGVACSLRGVWLAVSGGVACSLTGCGLQSQGGVAQQS